MISVFVPGPSGLVAVEPSPKTLPQNVVWMDLNRPDEAEEALVEAFLDIDVPTHEERVEIETSSRLYEEDGALIMSATILCGMQAGRPETTVATFILKGTRLVSVRYDDPTAFTIARQRALKGGSAVHQGKGMLIIMLDAIVDRIADLLEMAGAEADRLSRDIFDIQKPSEPVLDYDGIIRSLGRLGTRLSKIHESLVSLSRLFQFLSTREKKVALSAADKAQVKSLTRDTRSLYEFAASLDNKVGFLLEATLGLVNLQQNQTIKIFSVLAVVFLPPTLIASLYGMNFDLMPELHWTWGYPLAVLAMVASAFGTWGFFRWKRWL
ncbi:magnesium transporter [Breoghania corrubedonensis]|uniref:Magnesium transport protein CorA n=1 Tax=Breoghania corrubedonensis TaxID=665038 RepID=A0A2T5VEK6_9HYPH|nr:magnesium transporter CorA family protein [Breoghania corrubedonensis]PTW62156.1 magnesium transporter [Breoghania corrubedonensis]